MFFYGVSIFGCGFCCCYLKTEIWHLEESKINGLNNAETVYTETIKIAQKNTYFVCNVSNHWNEDRNWSYWWDFNRLTSVLYQCEHCICDFSFRFQCWILVFVFWIPVIHNEKETRTISDFWWRLLHISIVVDEKMCWRFDSFTSHTKSLVQISLYVQRSLYFHVLTTSMLKLVRKTDAFRCWP